MRGQIQEHKEELLALLRGGSAISANTISPIRSVRGDQPAPLSFAQERLWFLEQLEPGRAVYNLCRAFRVTGALNLKALARSFDEILKRHEALRTKFLVLDGRPVQLVAPAERIPIASIDLRPLDPAARERETARLILAQTGQPFDLAQGRLLRVSLLRQSDQEHVLVATTHHMVADAWSMGILLRELWALYEAFVKGRVPRLPDLPVQYRDFAVWQRESLAGRALDSHLVYWRTQFADAPVLDLPADHRRPSRQSFRGGRCPISLSTSLTAALKELSRREGVTLFMTLLAAFQVLLSRYSGQEDIAVGAPAADRQRIEFEGMIGVFVNTLVLRTDLSGQPSFIELLRRVKKVCLDADTHQEIPFEKLVAELNVRRELSRNPLFQAMLVLQNTPVASPEPSDIGLTPIEIENPTAQLDLSLYLRERAGRLIGYFEYATDLFERATIERMAEHFQVLLEGIVGSPERAMTKLPMLTTAERRQLLIEWNDTMAAYPRDACIHQLFEAQVERTPDGVALEYENVRMAYRDLNRRANRLARHLRRLGIGPEKLVGVMLDRSVNMFVSLLAVLKAGGAYLPLDPTYPKARLEFMLADAGAGILLTEKKYQDLMGSHRAKTIYVDRLRLRDGGGDADLRNEITAENAAYVIYTSGSTGTPKGVVGLHRGALNRFSWMWRAYPFDLGEKNCQKTSLSFVDSIWEIFGALLQGVPTAIVPDAIAKEPQLLVRYLSERKVTRLVVVPSLLKGILDQCPDVNEQLSELRYCFTSGEALPTPWAARFGEKMPKCRLINLYGSSEVSADVTCHEIDSVSDDAAIPIGRPIQNSQLYLLDCELQPVPVGVCGEIYIGGDNLARGYLHRPELTAEKFIANPFHQNASPHLFRSGDLARYRADGNLEFLGRADKQIKIRGCRIELNEVEAALSRHPGVRECLVAVSEEATAGDEPFRIQDANAAESLIAYVVPVKLPPSAGELRSFLKRQLPEFMIPANFVRLDALPLAPNGKRDRRALPLRAAEFGGDHETIEPRTEVESLVAQIWKEALKLPKIGIDDDFFELGGHSLLAAQIVAQLRAALDRPVSLHHLFEAPTVAGLAEIIERSLRTEAAAELPPIKPLVRKRFLPLSFAQEPLFLFGQLFGGGDFLNMPYAYQLTGPLDVAALHGAIQEIVRRHAALRTGFTEMDGEPRQFVRRKVNIGLPFIDLSRLPKETLGGELDRLSRADARRTFDLEKPPLLRVKLLRLGDERHVLLVTMHHIITDQGSMDLFRKELAILYETISQGLPVSLPDLPIQFGDFTAWQREVLSRGLLDSQISYWRSQLGELSPPLEFPCVLNRTKAARFHSTRKPIEIGEAFFARIKDFAGEHHCTPFMVLVSALNILLNRYTEATDIRIGTLAANRSQPGTGGLIGYFVNALILRTKVSPMMKCHEVLKEVRQVCLSAYAHPDVPFEYLESLLEKKHKHRGTSLYQVMLNYRGLSTAPRISNGLTIASWDGQNRAADPGIAISRLDLNFHLRELPTKLTGAVNYKTDLFDEEQITRFLGGFSASLDQMVADADCRISKIKLV